jgi:serine/threonine-protein kinase
VRSIGRYRILERIASGGMADVHRAEVVGAEGVRKEVALKLVRGEHAGSSEFVAMFVQEARLAARLSHANIVQVFEFDQADGRYFIAMELVRGHHLGRVLDACRERGLRFGVPRAVFVAAELATALAYAHGPGGGEAGVVHRDVSPHNVLVSWEGEVKLADFGIARAASQAGMTRPGTLKGKLAYMAPEQARAEPVDGRADLFALGVVLWELLAGRRLFARESEAAALEALLRGPAPSPPSAWNEAVPPELDAIVLGCLEREPGLRIGSARELVGRLRALLLRIAKSPDEWELRPLMYELWPEGPLAAPAPDGDPTRVRPAAATVAAPPSPLAAEPLEDETLTLSPAPRGVPRWRVPAVATTLAATLVVALAARMRGGSAPATSVVGRGSDLPAAVAPSAAQARPAPGEPPDAGPPARGGSQTPPVSLPSGALFELGLPAAATGEGLLSVNATPWATLLVNGRRVGDTPREVRLPAGRHAVRVEHPRLGNVDATVEIVAGRRTAWYPRLNR